MCIECNHLLDAKAVKGFGGGDGAAFISRVKCTGSEKGLIDCPYKDAKNHDCSNAGVTCGKSASESAMLTKIFYISCNVVNRCGQV